MKILKNTKYGLGNKYYKQHLSIINPIIGMKMTSKEIDVLSAFMALPDDLVKKHRFGTTARKIVMETLELSPGGLGNYLNSLNKKDLIFKNDYDVYEIRPFLIPENEVQEYNFIIGKNEAGK